MKMQADIIHTARGWINTPFRHQGRTKGRACDCAGLIYGVARELGLVDMTLPAYGKEPNGDLMARTLQSIPGIQKVSDTKPGDVLLFKFARYPQHLGFYTGKTIIHSYESIGKVAEHQFDEKWQKRHVATYRFSGVA